MNILVWILFGLIVGLSFAAFDQKLTFGSTFGSVMLGILGATAGGILVSVILNIDIADFSFITFLVAVVSSVMLLIIVKLARENRKV